MVSISSCSSSIAISSSEISSSSSLIYLDEDTETFAELQEDAFEKMKEKLPKIGREKFLDWEKGFRVCKTSDGTINGDLDFDNYFFTIDIEGKTIPMTFKSAQARGYMDVAQTIHDTLVKELNEADIK